MEANALFAAALGLANTWYVNAIDLDPCAKTPGGFGSTSAAAARLPKP